jgi:hypothetical protein
MAHRFTPSGPYSAPRPHGVLSSAAAPWFPCAGGVFEILLWRCLLRVCARSFSTQHASELWMGDDQQTRNPLQHAMQAATQILGVKCCEAFIQDNQLGALEQRAGDVEPTPFAMR